MRRAPGRTSPPRRRTRRRWTLRQASCQGQFVVCFAVSVCIFLCSFKLASQFSSCSVCSMTSTSFGQGGQAEISIQKARDLALLKPNARMAQALAVSWHRSCAGRIPAGGGKGNEVEKHFGCGLVSRRFQSGMLVLNPALKAPYAGPYASCETRKTSKRWTAIGIVYKVCIRQ